MKDINRMDRDLAMASVRWWAIRGLSPFIPGYAALARRQNHRSGYQVSREPMRLKIGTGVVSAISGPFLAERLEQALHQPCTGIDGGDEQVFLHGVRAVAVDAQ